MFPPSSVPIAIFTMTRTRTSSVSQRAPFLNNFFNFFVVCNTANLELPPLPGLDGKLITSFTSDCRKSSIYTKCIWLTLFACDVDQERAECRNCAAMEHHNITTHEQEPLCLSKHEEIRSISKGASHIGLPTKVHLFQMELCYF